MTLSSLFLPTPDYSLTQPDFMNFPEVDRTEWNKGGWGGGGGGVGWKGGKGKNASINALTLLAFLFFLNILQNCLKETINATPTMMVMMMTSSEATIRKKRDIGTGEPNKTTSELEEQTTSHNDWTDTQIKNVVNDHVETYWSSDNARSKYTLIDASGVHENILNQSSKGKKKIKTLKILKKLATIQKMEDKIKGHVYKPEHYNQNFKSKIKNGSYRMTEKENSYITFFMNIVGNIYEKLHLENVLCCNFGACMSKRFQRQLQDISPGISKMIKNTISLVCSESQPEMCQSDSRLKCQSPLARSLINFVSSYFRTISHKYNE